MNGSTQPAVSMDVVEPLAEHSPDVVRIFNCLPSADTDSDWTFATAAAAGPVAPLVPIPTAVDLRESWWEIGNQKSSGSCVGWAIADSLIRWHFVQKGRLPKNRKLSVRYVWMAAKETDEFVHRPTSFIEADGTSLKAALSIASNYGVVENSLLPFGSGKLYEYDANTFYAVAARLRINSYYNLNRNLTYWRQWIAQNGPIAVRLDVDDAFFNAAGAGVLDNYVHPGYPRGHAVALVGYTEDGFIVRNSWGECWGDHGFVYVSDNYAQAAFTEAYGVEVW